MDQKAYTVECGNAKCKKSFPIAVMIDTTNPDKKAPTSKEVTCPFCQTMLTVDFQQPLATDSVVLRGLPK